MSRFHTGKKCCFQNFQLFELKAMEEYFQEMAGKGWMLDEIRDGNFYYFKKTEPRQLVFSVEIVGNMSVLAAEENRTAQSYRSYCEAAGWKFVSSNRSVQIFCAEEGTAPVAIETDERLKFDSVWRQVRKQMLAALLLIAVWILQFFVLPFSWETLLQDDVSWLSRILMLGIILLFLPEPFCGLRWYLRGRRALREYRSVSYSDWKSHRIYIFFYKLGFGTAMISFFFLVFLNAVQRGAASGGYQVVYFVLYLLLLLGIGNHLRNLGFSWKKYIAVTIGLGVAFAVLMTGIAFALTPFYRNEPEESAAEEAFLTLADLGVEINPADTEERYSQKGQSLFGSMTDVSLEQAAWEGGDSVSMNYQLYRSPSSFILEKIREERLEGRSYSGGIRMTAETELLEEWEGIQIYAVTEYIREADGALLSKDFRRYLLEKEDALCFLYLRGDYERSAEEILRLTAERM